MIELILLFICSAGFLETVTAANVGEACTAPGDCTVASSTCNANGICECDSTHFKASATECTLKKNLKDNCTNGITGQCMTANAICIETSTSGLFQCLCKGTHYESNGACVEKIDIQTGCTSGLENQCKTANADCIETPTANVFQCLCKPMYYLNSGECSEKKAYGGTCMTSTECKDANADCLGDPKTCSCKTGYFADSNNDNMCTQKIALNGTCVTGPTGQCATDNAECMNAAAGTTLCLCKSTHYEDNGACSEKKDLTVACTGPGQCKDANAECTDNTCKCNDGFFINTSVCAAKLSNGATCTATEECKDANAECTSDPKVCTCKAGYFQDTNDNQLCKSKIDLNADCSPGPTDQCSTTNAECKADANSNNKCLCGTMYYEESGQCTQKKSLHESCSSNDQCKDNNAECADSICTCKDMFFKNADVCSSKGGYNGECTTIIADSCLYSLTCANDKCVCDDASNTFFERSTNTCKQKIALNVACNALDQNQCMDPLAICSKHGMGVKCICNGDSYDKNGACAARIKHYSTCIEDGHVDQCIDGAKCTKRNDEFQCVCENGVKDDNTCNGAIKLVGNLLFAASVLVVSFMLF